MTLDVPTVETIIALFSPLVVALVKQTGLGTVANSVLAIIVYIAFGIGAVIVKGDAITLDTVVPTIVLFGTIGTAAYVAFWRNIGDPQVNAATSVIKPT